MKDLEKILEGLLFVSGDGLDKGYIMEKLSVTDKELTKAIDKLKEKYCGESGIHLIFYKNKIQLCSNPDYADEISLVLNPIRERNLSKSTLEVIAIVCYKQPVTRLEIEEIRGVNSDYAIQTLLSHNLIEVVGRKETIGKPLLFGTTDNFLKRFQIEDINELPDYEDILKQVETIERDNDHLYNEFEIEDEDNKLTEEERQERDLQLREERRALQEKDNALIESLKESQKALENVNKRVLDDLKAQQEPQQSEQKTDEPAQGTASQEQTEPVLTNEQIDMLLKQNEEEMPDFLKDEKDLKLID